MTNVAQSNSWLSNTSCNLMKDQLNPLNRHLNGWTSYPNTYLGSRPCISLIKHYNYNDWFFAPCTGLYTFCKCSKYVNAVPWLRFGNRDIRNLALWSVHGNYMSLWDSSPSHHLCQTQAAGKIQFVILNLPSMPRSEFLRVCFVASSTDAGRAVFPVIGGVSVLKLTFTRDIRYPI